MVHRYPTVELEVGLMKLRDAKQAEVDDLNAQLQAVVMATIEDFLHGLKREQPSSQMVISHARSRLRGVTENDVLGALAQMEEDGWVGHTGARPIDHWELFTVHHCHVSDHLDFLYDGEGSRHPKLYECRICGEVWVCQLKINSNTRSGWTRGGDVRWLPRSIQAQRVG